jgi:hypothetical protein
MMATGGKSGNRSLESADANLASQWHTTLNGPLLPSEVSPGSKKKVWWRCSEGHDFEAQVGNRFSRGDGCPYCSGRYAIKGVDDLASCEPALAHEWDSEKPPLAFHPVMSRFARISRSGGNASLDTAGSPP